MSCAAPTAPLVNELSSVIPSPVNLKYGSTKFIAVAVKRISVLAEGLGVAPSLSYTIE